MISDADTDSETSDSSESAFVDKALWEGADTREHLKCLEWLFHREENPAFAEDVTLAMREATVLVLLVLSRFISAEHDPVHLATGAPKLPVCVILIYTLTVCKTTGQTLRAARGSMFGTCLSICNVWIVNILFRATHGGKGDFTIVDLPSRYGYGGPMWWLVLLNGVAFILVLMLLRFHMNTRIMAIRSFVFHWMADLATEDAEAFSFSFTSPRMQELFGALTGCVLAVLTTLLPKPCLAISRAGTLGVELADTLEGTWRSCTEYLLSAEADADNTGVINKQLRGFYGAFHGLNEKLDIAEWETPFLARRHGNKRLMLRGLAAVLREGHDRLLSVERSCEEGVFSQTHSALMNEIRGQATEALSTASRLLAYCVKACLDGRIIRKEVEVLEQLVAKASAAEKELSAAIMSARAKISNSRIGTELVNAQCFGFHLCANSRMVVDFAEKLINFKSTGEPPIIARSIHGLLDATSKSTCTLQTDANHLSFVLRNVPTILLGMVIGYYGSGHLIDRHDATIASTTAIIMQEFTGSTLRKTSGRLQAVVIGGISGQFLYGLFPECGPTTYAVVAVVIFLWSTGTLLVYHSSGNAIGMLLAVFACTHEAMQCENGHEESPNAKPIISVVVALGCALVVEAVLSVTPCLPQSIRVRRASSLAAGKLREALVSMAAAFKDVVDPSHRVVREHKGNFVALLSACRELGAEGAVEMRLHRPPWPSDLFKMVVDLLERVFVTLCTLEFAASEGEEAGRKIDIYCQVVELPSFARLCEDIMGLFDEAEDLLDIFSEEAVRKKQGGTSIMPRSKAEKVHAANLEGVFADLLTIKWRSGGGTLESDGLSVACMAVKCLTSVRSDLLALRHELLCH